MKGVWLEDLTWPEAKVWFDREAVVLIPIGAASKEHGHALPLCTDYLLARNITDRVLAQVPIVAAPVVSYGYYPAFRHYPGSQTISPSTFALLLDEILSGFVSQGVKNLVIYNTGFSTEATVTNVVREFFERTGVRVSIAHIRLLGHQRDSMLQQKMGGHGDEHETSIILELDEKRVRKDKLVTDYGHSLEQPASKFYIPGIFSGDPKSGRDYTATGIKGDATLATKEKGAAIVSAIVDDIVTGLKTHYADALAKSK
jgi:creatinine amidohydrolase